MSFASATKASREARDLRASVRLTRSKTVNKPLVSSVFELNTMVELSHDSTWVPVMIVKEFENGKKFKIKDCNKLFGRKQSTTTVDSLRVRPTQPPPPPLSVGRYKLLEDVEVLTDGVWRQGVVTSILSEGRYIVRIKATQVGSEFIHSDLRPLMEWKDGVWHQTSKPKLEDETHSDGKRNNSVANNNTLKRKRGELEHNSDLNHIVVNNSGVNVEETLEDDTRVVLPFKKKSPIWSTCEAMEVLKKVPQRPHFRPLFELKEDFREGTALGLIVSFSGLIQKLKNLEPYVTISQLDIFKESFAELEKHGFDVTKPLSLINELLGLKDRQLNVMEKLKGESSKKHKAEEELNEVEGRIAELRRQEMALKIQKDAACEKICETEASERKLGVELENVELGFKTIVSAAPW